MGKTIKTEYVNFAKAAEISGVSVHTVRKWAQDKRLKKFKVAGIRSPLVKKDDIRRLTKPVQVK